MVQIVNPDFNIRVGIKNNEVVGVDWTELYDKEFKDKMVSPDLVKETVIEFFQKAIEVLKRWTQHWLLEKIELI